MTLSPAGNGWSVGNAHDKESATRPWYSTGDYHPARVDFTANPQPQRRTEEAQGAVGRRVSPYYPFNPRTRGDRPRSTLVLVLKYPAVFHSPRVTRLAQPRAHAGNYGSFTLFYFPVADM